VPGRGRRRSAVQTTMRQESHRHRVSSPRCLDGYWVGQKASLGGAFLALRRCLRPSMASRQAPARMIVSPG